MTAPFTRREELPDLPFRRYRKLPKTVTAVQLTEPEVVQNPFATEGYRGKPGDWRAMGRIRKVRWFLSTLVLTPWAVVTVASYGLDAVVDRNPVSPPGYFFLAVRD